jgi:hypothetical protein
MFPLKALFSSERSSEPLIGAVAAESREQGGTQQGRVRTPVVWGQGIPLQPPRTIRRPTENVPKRADKAAQTTSQILGVELNILLGILPGHASVTDAVTRLQRERDRALRRIDELHEHYKKELKSWDDSNYKMSQWNNDRHKNQLVIATNETAQCKQQLK